MRGTVRARNERARREKTEWPFFSFAYKPRLVFTLSSPSSTTTPGGSGEGTGGLEGEEEEEEEEEEGEGEA